MEKEFSPERPETPNYLQEIHQVIRDGQRGLISFKEVQAFCVAIAIRVLSEKSEERQCTFDPTDLSSSDPSS